MQWEKQGKTLHKTFSFSKYMDGVAFVHEVAILAEQMDHHPEMLLGYCTVAITLTTHDVGCVTDKDYQLARMIDAL